MTDTVYPAHTSKPAPVNRWLAAGVYVLVALAVGWHVVALLDWLPRSPFDFDARMAYIPYAQRLLNEGWPFLFTTDALQVPPFSFVFPALFGADLGVQKHIGIAMSAAVVVMLFRSGVLLHSTLAGLAAALLYALSPVPLPYLCTGSVEPLFMFLLMTWAWGMAEGTAGRRWGFVVAGLTIGLASLTRATLLYYLPLVLAGALVASRLQPGARFVWRGILVTHAIGLAMIAPFLLHNLIRFGLPAISTGAGVALYLGHHPLTWGFDPLYFGMTYDFGILLNDGGARHLELANDRVLFGAAKRVIASYDVVFLAKLYAVKLLSFLFVSNVEWIGPVAQLRAWRVPLICLSLVAIPGLRARPALLVVAGASAFQIAAHVPVLYAHRYSVVALDVPLALLAGVGVATAWREWSWRAMATGLALTVAAMVTGLLIANNAQVLQPNIDTASNVTALERDRHQLLLTAGTGATLVAPGRVRTTEGIAEIDIDLSHEPIESNRMYVLSLDASLDVPMNRPASCAVWVKYRTGDESFRYERAFFTHWNTDGRQRRILNGVWERIHIDRPGWLRLQFQCDVGATIDIQRLALVHPFFSQEVLRKHFNGRGVLKPE